MGSVVAALCDGDRVWAGAGRSEASAERAQAASLRDVGSIDAMAATCDTIVSICPPEAASTVAAEVAAAGFTGRYVDANAIAPDSARAVGGHFDHFVDGCLIGSPPAEPGRIRLYLSGDEAAEAAQLWAGTAIEVRVIDGGPGAASALKMAFAGWTKGSSALLLAVRAYAAAAGVEDDLVREWETSIPHLPDRSSDTATNTAPKAWRFVGEMREIATAMEAAGVPGDFHRGAARIYEAMAPFRTVPPIDLATVLHAIAEGEP
jgi:3-hydroxyisobutyrate dehydrogenase-like beta-hydroxyacid dehydrogenase